MGTREHEVNLGGKELSEPSLVLVSLLINTLQKIREMEYIVLLFKTMEK